MTDVYSFLYIFRRGLRLRGKKLCDATDTPPAEAEEEEDNKGEEEEDERKKREGEKNSETGEGQVDSDDCEVCPGTEAPPFIWTIIKEFKVQWKLSLW